MKSYRMHGAHKSRNILCGKDQPRYRNGEQTKDAETKRTYKGVLFRYLTCIGNQCICSTKNLRHEGDPLRSMRSFDLTDPKQLAIAIQKT